MSPSILSHLTLVFHHLLSLSLSPSHLLLLLPTLLLPPLLYFILKTLLYDPLTSPLRKLQGPPGGRGAAGHYFEVLIGEMIQETIFPWIDKYGKTFVTNGPFGIYHRLYSIDPLALQHVLRHTQIYEKPMMLRKALGRYLRSGLINAEGPRHRLIRKILHPLFSTSNLREDMFPHMRSKALELRRVWLDKISGSGTELEGEGAGVLMDVLDGLARSSFDIIGLTAFDHAFESLRACTSGTWSVIWPGEEELALAARDRAQASPAKEGKDKEDQKSKDLRMAAGMDADNEKQRPHHEYEHSEGNKAFEAYDRMFEPCEGRNELRGMLSVVWPGIDKFFPTENSRRVAAGMGSIDNLTEKLVKAKKAELIEAERLGLASGLGEKTGGGRGKDLLSLMVKADMALKPEQRMTDLEISGALATFMFAGSDTGSVAMAWSLYHLASHPTIQSQLREECSSYGENISMEDLDSLPLLDMVVKEILRLHPSINLTVREAKRDDVIPLAEEIRLKSGVVVREVRIRKGQYMYLPIEGLNLSKDAWGEDSTEFRPSRWADSKILASSGLGVDHNVLSFIDGPRKCLGYRMGVIETKMHLFFLIQQFEFARHSAINMFSINMFTNRPTCGDPRFPLTMNMPLIIRPCKN